MSAMTIRNLSEELHRALKVRAAARGHSTEAEVRAILEAVALPPQRVQLGSLLAQIGREAELSDEDFAAFDEVRERESEAPLDLS